MTELTPAMQTSGEPATDVQNLPIPQPFPARLKAAMDRRPPAAISICSVAAIVGGVSGEVAIGMWQNLGLVPEGLIFVLLLAIQAGIAFSVIIYVALIWFRLPNLSRDAARKALGGVVKWEAGWVFLAALAYGGPHLAPSIHFSWGSMDATLISLITIGLVVSGVGDTFVNWPFGRETKTDASSWKRDAWGERAADPQQ